MERLTVESNRLEVPSKQRTRVLGWWVAEFVDIVEGRECGELTKGPLAGGLYITI